MVKKGLGVVCLVFIAPSQRNDAMALYLYIYLYKYVSDLK